MKVLPSMLTRFALLLAAASPLVALPAVPALAQDTVASTRSAPQPAPSVDTIPPARDVDYPGTVAINVDATDVRRGIFRVEQTIPVAAAGPMVLLYPKWLPGNHAPTGPIDQLAGLRITANGKPVAWRRDTTDVYAFHIDVPAGARAIEVELQFLSPTARDQGRIVVTPAMMNIQPNDMTLYPAGYFTRRIPVSFTVKYPNGWKAATALRPARTSGSTVTYQTVDYDTLVDSPIFAGEHHRREQLSPTVALNIFADDPAQLAATPEQIAPHRTLVDQAVKLFGAQHYDHYDFLLAVSDRQSGIGLEHHRSSENGVGGNYFTEWEEATDDRDLLPHEFTHSWNGKFRRGADLWTPDFRAPMQDSLLWVYEGQTQFWGYVLAARSGLWTKQDALDSFANVAAYLDVGPGRQWRPVADTTNDPIVSGRGPKAWRSYQRNEDYYVEGALVWLDADSLIREKTGGAKSLDDFARAFFGLEDRDWGVVTYRFEDVVATLNSVVPHDWATFLNERINGTTRNAPLAGFTRGGYRLTYGEEPNALAKKIETASKGQNLLYSIGFSTDSAGDLTQVMWGGPAFDAGLTVGTKLLAVGDLAYDADRLKTAITAAKGGKEPIRLTVQNGDFIRQVDVKWNGGLRYPRLERTGTGPSSLDALLTAK